MDTEDLDSIPRRPSPSDLYYRMMLVDPVLVRILAVFGVLTVLGFGFYLNRPKGAPEQTVASLALGAVAPPFDVMTTTGRFTLAATDRPVLLTIFESWRSTCRSHAERLARLERRYGREILFISVSSGTADAAGYEPETWDDVNSFAQRADARYPLALDANSAVAKRYGIPRTPTDFYINRDGTIFGITVGDLADDEIENDIRQTLIADKRSRLHFKHKFGLAFRIDRSRETSSLNQAALF